MTEKKNIDKKDLSREQKGKSESPSLSRRKTINTIVIAGGIATVDKWGKPIVDSVVTPVHANMSIGGGGDPGDGTTPTPPPASPSATPAVTPSATPAPSPSPSATPAPSASPSPTTSIFVTGT